MKLAQVRESLNHALGPLLPGWKLVKKDEAFVRPIAGGKQWVSISIVDYRPEFRFSLTMATRLDAVEQINNQFSGATGSGTGRTSTTMTQLEYFFADENRNPYDPKQYSVATEDDIVAAVRVLEPVLRDRILPWLDAHRGLAAIDSALNGDDARIDTSYLGHRAMSALTVARLARNPSFEVLVARYEEAIRSLPQMERDKLAALIAHLRTT